MEWGDIEHSLDLPAGCRACIAHLRVLIRHPLAGKVEVMPA
jgi:hypothetical protein